MFPDHVSAHFEASLDRMVSIMVRFYIKRQSRSSQPGFGSALRLELISLRVISSQNIRYFARVRLEKLWVQVYGYNQH